MSFDIGFTIRAFPKILAAVPMTLFLTVVSMALGLIVGFIIALTRIYRVPVLQQISVAYVSLVRGTPLVVNIYIAYFGIPDLLYFLSQRYGWHINVQNIPALVYAIVAFTIDTSAYLSETIRSALGAVDSGQFEASYSIGMTKFQAYKRIIIPQALVIAIPSFGNLLLGLIKGTSLAFTISVMELMAVAKIQADIAYNYIEVYLIVSVIYWAICFTFEKIFSRIENKLNRFKVEVRL
jgi:L-cystine transport system permease protein